MGYLQSGIRPSRITGKADGVTDGKKVSVVVKEKLDILVAHETVPPSDTPSHSPPAVLIEALKSYQRIYECPFQKIVEMLETDGLSLVEQVYPVVTEPPYNVLQEAGSSGAD